MLRKMIPVTCFALLLGLAALPAAGEHGGKHLNNTDVNGVAIQGYDPVGYFTDNKPVMGSKEFSSSYDGATYWFASAEHRATFDADPAKYAPQYGGFCAYAVSLKALRPIDPAIFQFVDGRLLLQHTQKAYDLYNKDTAGNTVKADANWPKLIEKKAGKFKAGKFDPPAK